MVMDEDREAFASANYIIEKLQKHDIKDITNLKLQKLLYFAYGVHLSLYSEKLFTAPIQAWQFGPVVPCVYRAFKVFGKNPISLNARAVISKEDYSDDGEVPKINEAQQENQAKSLLVACAAYGKKKAWDLVDITHDDGSAWKKCYNSNAKVTNIADEDIKAEFEKYIDTLANYLLG